LAQASNHTCAKFLSGSQEFYKKMEINLVAKILVNESQIQHGINFTIIKVVQNKTGML